MLPLEIFCDEAWRITIYKSNVVVAVFMVKAKNAVQYASWNEI